jgi:hypothetical protein
VPQVVGSAAEGRPTLGGGEGLGAGVGPHGAVGRVLEDAAPGGLEDPAVPWSVQAVPAREAEAARTILPHPLAGRYRSLSRSMTASDGRSAA